MKHLYYGQLVYEIFRLKEKQMKSKDNGHQWIPHQIFWL